MARIVWVAWWRNGRAPDLPSGSREFDPRPVRRCLRRLWTSCSHSHSSTLAVFVTAWSRYAGLAVDERRLKAFPAGPVLTGVVYGRPRQSAAVKRTALCVHVDGHRRRSLAAPVTSAPRPAGLCRPPPRSASSPQRRASFETHPRLSGGPLGCPRPSSRLTSWLDPFACSKTSCYYSTGSEKPHRCCHLENTVKYVEFNDCRQVWTCLSMSIQNCLFPLGDPAPT